MTTSPLQTLIANWYHRRGKDSCRDACVNVDIQVTWKTCIFCLIGGGKPWSSSIGELENFGHTFALQCHANYRD